MEKEMGALRYPILLIFALLLSACVQSESWRTGEIGDFQQPAVNEYIYTNYNYQKPESNCEKSAACSKALIEVFKDEEDNIGYELGFIEFSERGNLFDDRRARFVMDRVSKYARSENGLLLVVFIHGWKNNASVDNSNVQSFRAALNNIASNEQHEMVDGRHIMGLYVGWRGSSVEFPFLDQTTFWERKQVAQQIGRDGVSALFLRLEEMDTINDHNLLVLLGHSFGGAMALSAYGEIILDRVNSELWQGARLNRPIADAFLLLNPAIEANEILHLKERIVRNQDKWPTIKSPNLMRVVSTAADKATHLAFPIGQTMGVNLSWNQKQLEREYLKNTELDEYFHESKLDTYTVGNFLPYHTQELSYEPEKENPWVFADLCEGEKRILESTREENVSVMPCSKYDPVQFIYTSSSFMSGHSDIFNEQVGTYISTVINEAHIESMHERKAQFEPDEAIDTCEEAFDFEQCIFEQHKTTIELMKRHQTENH